MASLARLGRSRGLNPSLLALLSSRRVPFVAPVTAVRNVWTKDWMPGAYPDTEKKRIVAAKKYGLRPEDYEPYPNDGFGHGDYPMLPQMPEAERNPYEDYDIPELKKNFNEPMHHDIDAMKEAWWNPNQKYKYSWTYMHAWFFGVMGSLFFVMFLTENYPATLAVLPKQYPRDGKHYTFEPVD